MIHVRRRQSPDLIWTSAIYLLAIAVGVLVSGLLVVLSGADPAAAFAALITGAVGTPSAIASSLVAATPLLLTGLATVIAYRAEVWSVGQEGQVLVGAMAAYQASLTLAGAPPLLVVAAAMLAGIAAAAALGGVSAVLKSRFGVNEIVSTVMLNYVVGYLLSYLLGGPWAATGGTVSYQQTPLLPQEVWLVIIALGTKLHLGFVLALAVVVGLQILLTRTALGYEVRAMGLNATALRQRGTNTARTLLIVMLISGGIAGLAGFSEVFGLTHRLRADALGGLGFSGIVIGMIGNLNPIGTLVAALCFGGLQSGALFMNVMTDVPAALIQAMQGIILLFCLIAGVLANFRLERVPS